VPADYEPLRNRNVGRRSWKRQLVPAVLLLTDFLLSLIVWRTSSALHDVWSNIELTQMTIFAMVAVITSWVGLRALLGLDPGYGLDSVEQLRRHAYATFASMAMLAILALGFQLGLLLSRPQLALVFLGLLILTPFAEYLVKSWMKKMGLWGKPVVVLGYKQAGTNVANILKNEWELGYNPIAIFDYRLGPTGALSEGVEVGPILDPAVEVAHEHGVDTAIVAMPHLRREHLAELVALASVSFRRVTVIPNLAGITNSAVVARDFAGILGVEIKYNLLDPWARRFKRALDVVATVIGGLLISPILATIFILIKLDSPGSAFYGHRRIGIEGRHFRCWKFRTMHTNAERLLDEHFRKNPHLRAEWEANHKLHDDPRVTRIGHLLRKTSLDELPQLWNVLRGEMSLTGPRPIVDAEVSKYGSVFELYSRIRPGMSGLWQISGRSSISYTERVALDSHYVRNWSVWLDLIILARTLKTVVRGRGAF
jgi:Undecaprenyl-phosphate galactose phosphotransferase WbaP